jgi:rubrerythrin
MSFRPFEERGIPIERQFRSWAELNVQPYDKEAVHPYSRCRGIVMNGIETEAVMFSHQMARHTADDSLKRKLALVRRAEAQQQKAIGWLIPGDETTLEVTLGYEQVAVDLTAWVARHEPDPYLRKVYEFGLLEDFDHLYRYANLLALTDGKAAERITGDLTEIMPGRPTIFEHRDPRDEIRRPMTVKGAKPQSMLNALTIMSAEQQTMNWYMNIGNRFQEPLARGLYLEIAEIEEQHVSHYESILDPTATWLQNLVMHEYNEVWLYYSFMLDEPDPRVRAIYELHLMMELEHLRIAGDLLRRYEDMEPTEFLPERLPEPVRFEPNKEYVRKVLRRQVDLTSDLDQFVDVADLAPDHRFFSYQQVVNRDGAPSEAVIAAMHREHGCEYRLQTEGPHPIDQGDERGGRRETAPGYERELQMAE